MNINYEVRETSDFGKGLFTLENIPANARVWTYNLNENVFEYNAEQTIAHLQGMPNLAAQQRFLDSSFGKADVLCLITDDGQYMNHAAPPDFNCKTDLQTGHCYSVRPILQGEQLFEDYASFSHPPFLFPLLKQYHCEPNYYALPAAAAGLFSINLCNIL
jgi:hypothetical protein